MAPIELYKTIEEKMTHYGGKPGKMFGALCIKAENNGKAAVMFWRDYMVFKLTGEPENEAKALDGVDLFTPMDNRSMAGWYQVPYDYKDKWETYARASLEYVKTLKK